MTAGRKIIGQSQNWGTPAKYVDAVRDFFGGTIHLDPCSNRHSIVNALVAYSLPHQDGLRESWDFPSIYVNPPYGIDREHGTSIKDWLKKCEEANRLYRSEVIALVPVATNTGQWKKYIYGKASAICFLYDTRLRFLIDGEDAGKGALMSCAIVYWGDRFERFFQVFMQFKYRELEGVAIGQHGKVHRQEELWTVSMIGTHEH